jgi:acyl carrier protein
MNRDQIFEQVKEILVELFEVPAEDVHLDAHLYEDLDLDSIDAVDMVVRLQQITGKRIKPEDFRNVRTVDHIVTAVEELLAD